MTRSQRIPMTSITALTLRAGQKTTSRRLSPVPQLQCKGSACRKFQPDVVQCVPVGSSGGADVEWSCQAELPRGIRFGNLEVGCEGWDDSSDPYVLKGSCGLTYNLVKSSSALEDDQGYLPSDDSGISWAWIIAALIALYYIWRSIRPTIARTFPTAADPRRWGGGWGGGGWGGGPGFGGGGSGGPPPPPYSAKPTQPGEAWKPGFWTGLAAGAAALQGANMLRGDGNATAGRRQGWGMRDEYDDRGVGSSRSWGRPSGGGSGGSGASGSGMRTSTGFGGTRNR